MKDLKQVEARPNRHGCHQQSEAARPGCLFIDKCSNAETCCQDRQQEQTE